MKFNDIKKIENNNDNIKKIENNNDNAPLPSKEKDESKIPNAFTGNLNLPNLNSKELELPEKISGTLDLSKLDLNALKQLVELLRNSKLNLKALEDGKLPEKISVDLDLSKLDPSVLARLKFPKIEEFPASEFNLNPEFKLDSELVEKINQMKYEREGEVKPINLDSKVASQLELPKLQTTDDFGITPEKFEAMRKLDFHGPDLRLEEVEENGPVRINTNRAVDLYTYNELKDEKGNLGAFHTAIEDDENPYSNEKGRSK